MTVRRVNDDGIDVGSHEGSYAVERVGCHTHTCGHTQATFLVFAGHWFIFGFRNILVGNQANELSFVVHHRQFLDFVLLQYLSGGRQVCLHVCGDEFLGCHHVIDGSQHIFLETEVAIRHDAHQMLLFVHHGYAADVIFVHEFQCILHAASALYRHGVVNHAVLGAFYNGNLARLLFDTHVFMYDTDAAFARNCDSHRRFRDGIHRSRNEGNLKFDVA